MTREHYDNLCRIIPFDGGVQPEGVIRVLHLFRAGGVSWPVDDDVEGYVQKGEKYFAKARFEDELRNYTSPEFRTPALEESIKQFSAAMFSGRLAEIILRDDV